MANVVRDVFKDFNDDNNIIDVEIENINLYKKSKKLEIYLKTNSFIKISELENFEKYLINRFQIEKIEFNINVLKEKGVLDFNQKLKEDWKDIVRYLSKKYPFIKTILKLSDVELEENKVIVILKNKNAKFLYSYEIDKEIEKIINNLYGIKCKVKYKENVTEESIKKQSEYLENLEKDACQELLNEINQKKENDKLDIINQDEKEVNNNDDQKENEKSVLIYGRTKK